MAWDDDAYYETELEIPSGRYGKLIAIPGGPGPSGPPGPQGPAGADSVVPGPVGPAGPTSLASFASVAAFPATGEAGKVFLAEDTGDSFRWDGAKYTRISERVLSAGITDATTVGRKVLTAVDEKAARTAIVAERAHQFNVADYGAVGDGVADDTAAIKSAVAAAAAVGGAVVFGRSHLVSSTIEVTGAVALRGRAGHSNTRGTLITSSALSGPVFHLKDRTIHMESVRITSTAERRAATTTTGHGVFLAATDVPNAAFLSRMSMTDVDIRDQPTDGVHGIGTLEMSNFLRVTVSDCVRHGFVFDGGAMSGWTNLQLPLFMVNMSACRAMECGGQALLCLFAGGNAPQGLCLDNFEALGCAWDVTKQNTMSGDAVSKNFQIQLAGRGHVVNRLDLEDQQYANTATQSGARPRTALTAPSKGVYSLVSGTQVTVPFFSCLQQSWYQGASATASSGLAILYPTIQPGQYATPQPIAIQTPSTMKGFDLRYLTGMTSGATRVVQNQSVGARIEADGVPLIGIPPTQFDYNCDLAPTSSTPSGGALTTTSLRTKVVTTGAATFYNIRLASGIYGYAGMELYLFHGGGGTITIQNTAGVGTDNIRTATGENILWTATDTVLHFVYDGAYWVQEGVPGTETRTHANSTYAAKGHTHVAGDVVGGAAFVAAPASPDSPGTLNQVARGTIGAVDHLFVCTATNVWKAVPLSVTTW